MLRCTDDALCMKWNKCHRLFSYTLSPFTHFEDDVLCGHVGTDSSSFGRATLNEMPEQALMELMVAGSPQGFHFHEMGKDFKPVERWTGVGLDKEGRISSIIWKFCAEKHIISLDCLPRHVVYLGISQNNARVSGDFTSLPRDMDKLICSNNYVQAE